MEDKIKEMKEELIKLKSQSNNIILNKEEKKKVLKK